MRAPTLVRAALAATALAAAGCWFDWPRFQQPCSGPAAQSAACTRPAIAAGGRHACALFGGRVWCWGENLSGQLGLPVVVPGAPSTASVPVVLSPTPRRVALSVDALEISAGDAHTCVIGADQGVWCWGENAAGQLGNGTTADAIQPTRVVGLGAALHVAAGGAFTCALLTDGTVWCWGSNLVGQLGVNGALGSATSATVPFRVAFGAGGAGDGGTAAGPSPDDPVAQIAAGSQHACARLAHGEVWCWGAGASGQLGHSRTPASSSAPVDVVGLSGAATAIALGANHSCALVAPGPSLVCWGDDRVGQVSGTPPPMRTSVALPTPSTAAASLGADTQLALGALHSCALTGGAVSCWGDDSTRAIGRSLTVQGASAISAGSGFTCVTIAPANAGDPPRVQCWGDNRVGQLGVARAFRESNPAQVRFPAEAGAIADLALGANHSCAVTADGEVYCWGRAAESQLSGVQTTDSSTPLRMPKPPMQVRAAAGVGQIAAGGNTTCAIYQAAGDAHALFCWGSSTHGAAGAASGAVSLATVNLAPMLTEGTDPTTPRFVDVSMGLQHGCLRLQTTGSAPVYQLRCWGDDGSDQLAVPAQPDCVLARCLTRPSAPLTSIGTLLDAAAALGDAHSCARSTYAGHAGVVCWGSNYYLQTGATSMAATAPQQPLVGSIVALAAGGAFTCAIVEGAMGLVCWGDNRYGQVGVTNAMCRSGSCGVPMQASDIHDADAIALGGSHGCMRSTGGEVRCWGANTFEQAGAWPSAGASEVARVRPVALPPEAGAVQALAAGGAHSCARTANGVWCWGDNREGQLGDGDELYSEPTSSFALADDTAAMDAGM